MRKVDEKIVKALVEGKCLAYSGQNMETGERGLRYEVTAGAANILYYWGAQVAHLELLTDKPNIEINFCGHLTQTTKKCINLGLDAFMEAAGSQWRASVYFHKRAPRLWVQGPDGEFTYDWDGDSITVDAFGKVTSYEGKATLVVPRHQVCATFHGGGTYSQPGYEDIETFDSLAEARRAFEERLSGWDRRYPCVDERAEMRVFYCDAIEVDLSYPDRIIYVGPRGGVKVECA